MRHTRRRALSLLSGIWSAPKPPRGGWHRADPGDGGGDGTAGGGPAGGGENDDAGDGDDKGPKIDGDFDAERAKKALASAREGEKKARERAKAAEDRTAAILKAAGLAPDGKADPEEQVRKLTEENAALKAADAANRVEKAIRTAAKTHTADADELLDSTKFLSQLKQLDPTADDYADKVGDLVKKAVKDNPAKYGTTGVKGGGRSGSSDHTGGGHGAPRSKDLSSAVARKLAG